MRVYTGKDYKDMCRKAANIISAQIILKPDSVLGLATGSTPVGIYAQLVNWYEKGDIDFAQIKTINLDEYLGLPPEDANSYMSFMQDNLFGKVNIRPKNINIPDGMCEDIEEECLRYDEVIARLGGADLQLLGIGRNGHIGFNEPERAFEIGSHCVELSENTREANARFFGGDKNAVPERAITMGIRNIMQSRMILVSISGREKADVVKRAFFGPVTPQVPASVLQLHNNVILVGDEEALSLI